MLILCSYFHEVKNILQDKNILPIGNYKLAYIQNASDLDRQNGIDTYRNEYEKEDYHSLGYSVDDIDLRILRGRELEEILSIYDFIHVGGGNTFYLKKIFDESNFSEILPSLIKKSLIAYIGTSAGSCILCPDIGYTQWDDDPNLVSSKNFQGLGIVPFYINPHCGEGNCKPSSLKAQEYCDNHGYSPYITLSDKQAILIEDTHFQLI